MDSQVSNSRSDYTFIVNTDGGFQKNKAAISYVIRNNKDEVLIAYATPSDAETNNEAEYNAVIHALNYLINLTKVPKGVSVLIKTDSELVTKQFNGEYNVNADNLKDKLSELQRVTSAFEVVSIMHIKRHYNQQADTLCNFVLEKYVVKDNAGDRDEDKDEDECRTI